MRNSIEADGASRQGCLRRKQNPLHPSPVCFPNSCAVCCTEAFLCWCLRLLSFGGVVVSVMDRQSRGQGSNSYWGRHSI